MKALPTVRAAALLAEPEKRRSLANRGERRTAQRGGHPSHWWVSVTRHRREQTSLAIRCAIRIRKYGANNTPGWLRSTGFAPRTFRAAKSRSRRFTK